VASPVCRELAIICCAVTTAGVPLLTAGRLPSNFFYRQNVKNAICQGGLAVNIGVW